MADVESLELQITGDATGAKKSIDDLIKTLDRLKTATSGGCGLSSVAQGMQQVSNSGKSVSTSTKKSAKSFANLATKVTAAVIALKKGGQVVASWVNESNKYTENMNLFNVSMGSYAKDAMLYAEAVSEAMGIDTSDWIRNQGVFMTLATGFGVATDRAATMSQQLTQLGYDISSFYNTSVEDAMTKLQSGISGELEPLRRLGYDLSQAKLEATALSLGIDKAVSSMTQAEKAELRYYAIMTQVTQVQGDMARTLNDPANQLRVLQAQLQMAARALGNIFIPALNAVLPYAIAAAKVIRILANTIAGLFGFTFPEVDTSGMSGLEDSAGGASDAIEDATGNAKKLKKMLLGIDELNVAPDAKSGSGADVGAGGGGFDFNLPTYDFLGEAANSRVNQIVEDMKKWLGLTGDITSWSDLFDTNLGQILVLVGEIGGALALWKLSKGLLDGIKELKDLKAAGLGAPLTIAAGAILTVTGLTIEFTGVVDAIQNGLDGLNFAEIVGGGLLGTGGAATLGAGLAVWLDTAFASAPVTLAITEAGINLGVGTMAAAGAALAASVVAIIAGIPMMFVGIYDAIKNGIDWLSALLIPLGATMAAAGIGAIIGACGGPIGAGVGALIGLCIGLMIDFGIWLWQKFDAIEAWFNDLPLFGKIVVAVVGTIIAALMLITLNVLPLLVVGVVAFLKKLEDVKDFLVQAAPWIKEHVVDPIIAKYKPFYDAFIEIKNYAVQQFTELKDGIISRVMLVWNKIVEIKNKIVEIFSALWWAFQTYLWQPLVDKVSAFYEANIKPVVDKVVACFTWAWNKVNEKFIQPLKAGLEKLRTFIAGLFEALGKAVVDFVVGQFKGVINGILYLLETKINNFIRLLNGAIGIINKIPGVSITKVELLSIPRLAEGGMVNEGQMFVAREAGPELVGNVGRKTAVMNNDQIVESVTRGVYQAVVQAMGQSGGTQIVEAKVNDKVLFEVVVDRNRRETMRTGYSPLLGGV